MPRRSLVLLQSLNNGRVNLQYTRIPLSSAFLAAKHLQIRRYIRETPCQILRHIINIDRCLLDHHLQKRTQKPCQAMIMVGQRRKLRQRQRQRGGNQQLLQRMSTLQNRNPSKSPSLSMTVCLQGVSRRSKRPSFSPCKRNLKLRSAWRSMKVWRIWTWKTPQAYTTSTIRITIISSKNDLALNHKEKAWIVKALRSRSSIEIKNGCKGRAQWEIAGFRMRMLIVDRRQEARKLETNKMKICTDQ